MSPTVSVIVPCFNHGQYVRESVQSVFAQSWPSVEVIVVDDGSDDPATIACLREMSDLPIQLRRVPHGGLARARNAGIAAASGQYLCALDADDLLAPEFLHKAVTRLEADASLTFVSCWLEAFDREQWSWTPTRCDLPALLAECTVCTASLVRLPAVRAIGGFDEHMPHQGYEDWDLWISLVERGYRGTIIPEVLFRYRRLPGSMSAHLASPDVHRDLMQYLVGKHRDSYERHMTEVLQLQDEDIGRLLRSNQRMERQVTTWLEPEVERRRAELSRLQEKVVQLDAREASTQNEKAMTARLTALEQQLDGERRRGAELAEALDERTQEVHALRTSKSWRITKPLRAVYDGWLAIARLGFGSRQ